MRFGDMLNEWISSNGYTVASVADAIGVEDITVERWIDGATFPKARLVNRVAALTGLDLADLLVAAGYTREHAIKMNKTPSVFHDKLVKAV